MTLEQYPDILSVEDIKEILRIGRRQAYELVGSNQFPIIRVGRSIRIVKEEFIKWVYEQETA